MITLSVVIPTFRGSPLGVIADINRVFDPATVEIIVVDDGSGPDWDIRGQEEDRGPDNVSIIRLPSRRGQAYATLVGVASSRGQTVATLDDDGEHPATALPKMLSLLNEQVDLVYGVPKVRTRIPGYRRLGTLVNNLLFSLCLGKPWSIPVTSFRVVRRELLHRSLRKPVRFAYLSAMLFAAGARAEVYRYSYRSSPESYPAHLENSQSARAVGATLRSRYRLGSLLQLYWRLVFYWGPLRLFSSLSRATKEQFG